jgi:hypothetical protein
MRAMLAVAEPRFDAPCVTRHGFDSMV